MTLPGGIARCFSISASSAAICSIPRRIRGNSHKLHSDLDRRTCRPVAALPAGFSGDGVFYGFADAPRVSLNEVKLFMR